MNMAKKSEHEGKPEWAHHAQAGPQEEKKPGGGGKGGGGGGGSAPDDSWRKQSEPHPITPGKPAPQGPDEQQKKPSEAKLVSQEPDAHLEIMPLAQTGGPMPAPTLATGSTMVNPYRNPIAPPNANTGPKSPPTAGNYPWG